MSELKVPVSSADHVQGDENAPITLVEYGDYECPHCAAAHPVVKEVQKHFGEQLRFVFRNFPLAQVHPYAQGAAESAEFAGSQGKFWEMHDTIFENQRHITTDGLVRLAEGIGLSGRDLVKALESKTYADRVRADFLGGVRSGVNGTPTFFINGHRHDGRVELEDLIEGIEQEQP